MQCPYCPTIIQNYSADIIYVIPSYIKRSLHFVSVPLADLKGAKNETIVNVYNDLTQSALIDVFTRDWE